MNNINSCKFNEELVSYLYGEIGEQDRLHFESHLAGCESCLGELDDLSLAHSSILEFKEVKFDHLPTPVIEIEYDRKLVVAPASVQIETDPVSKPWFAAVRDLFTLSPTWATAATALGALAICVGIYFAFNSADRVQMAKDDLQKASPVTSTVANNSKLPDEVLQPGKELVQTSPKPLPTPEIIEKNTSEPANEKTTPITISTTTTHKNKPVTKTPGNKSVKPGTSEKPSKPLPKKKNLNIPDTDDEEEDTLRLADMFEELTASTTK